ncbi:hypothetical protein SKAU_G00032450 [Synaphobranchus kaupii]|uniref:Transmembrane protein 129 n=1 Tax=Synaphobranchus kaupii TaxID=118154 RepID=A0A9Q1JG32_SYNKA|nr:hypothetical protein SKAU_G00032450 [Synaphobranchus kaupii]
MFSGWLGSEDIGFVQYHIKRTSVTLLVHSILPLGYYFGMCIAAPDKNLWYVHSASEGWQLYFTMSVTLPLFSLVPGVVVTDTWVMKVTTYYLHVAQQQDIHLTVVDSKQHELSPDSNTPVQILTITVASINPNVKPFDIRLNSTEYGELREKLHAPIRNAANVVIHQTLSDLFLETFKSHVEVNQIYSLPSGLELEPCIGCMQVSANTKLLRLCQDEGLYEGQYEGDCQQCYCRPMWCLTCLGKWFASRQDQQHPETWLASRVPCPTCRAKFCILDVCMVQ